MFERFTKEARLAVTDGTEIAREAGVMSVEAEHLLLAIAAGDSRAAGALRRAGLDRAGLESALDDEATRSLAAVGVRAEPLTFSPFTKPPRLGASAKLVLERALKIALQRRDRQIGSEHLVLAALQPELGTLPRALQLAGVDREALREAVAAV